MKMARGYQFLGKSSENLAKTLKTCYIPSPHGLAAPAVDLPSFRRGNALGDLTD